MTLPSGYEYADMLFRNITTTSSPYFDLGVVASSDKEISMLFNADGDARMYVFGARRQNSTSSDQQLNLFYGGSTTSYLGYASARPSLTTKLYTNNGKSLQKEANLFTFNVENKEIVEVTGASTTFTGTQNMYLFALNNAGTPSFGSAPQDGYLSFACVRISSGGALTHDLIPVYDTVNDEQCLYNRVDGTVIQKSGSGDWTWRDNTHCLLTLESDVGGYAYARTNADIETDKLYCIVNNSFSFSDGLDGGWYATELNAYENYGYSFVGWEKGGQIISTNRRIFVLLAEDTTITAKFVKNAQDEKNQCYLMCFAYGVQSDQTNIPQTLYYVPVLNANIKVDGVSKTTSTITVNELPSAVKPGSVVALKNPRGKILYIGVIKSVADNVLTCREPLSLFDADFLFTSTKNSTTSAMESLHKYMQSYTQGYPSTKNIAAEKNASVIRLMQNVAYDVSTKLSIESKSNMNITAPVIEEVNVGNLEDHFLKAFDDFGIYIQYGIVDIGGIYLGLLIANPRTQEPLLLGDNSEAVTNISVDVQEMENTTLEVYDSTGATFRGIYSVKEDGTITNYNYPPTDESSFIAYYSCKPKIITSDDSIKTVVEQYLSNAKYNHKITFNLDLDSVLYSLDALNIGRRVNFYYKDKVYNSIITGIEWNLPENTEDPINVKVILGKVRNKLTTKINLGKVKK